MFSLLGSLSFSSSRWDTVEFRNSWEGVQTEDVAQGTGSGRLGQRRVKINRMTHVMQKWWRIRESNSWPSGCDPVQWLDSSPCITGQFININALLHRVTWLNNPDFHSQCSKIVPSKDGLNSYKPRNQSTPHYRKKREQGIIYIVHAEKRGSWKLPL